MGHNVSREKQDHRDRQITVLQSIELGWRAELWCPGCERFRVAPYSRLLTAGLLEATWMRAVRRMRCPRCRRAPGMIALHFGPKLVVLMKVTSLGA